MLDFLKSERHAFFSAMDALHIPVDETDFERYHAINHELRKALERGDVSDKVLRPLHFERLLSARESWNGEMVNDTYIANLASSGHLGNH